MYVYAMTMQQSLISVLERVLDTGKISNVAPAGPGRLRFPSPRLA